MELRVMLEFVSKLLRLTADGCDDVVAAGHDGFANFETEAARSSSDDPCLCRFH